VAGGILIAPDPPFALDRRFVGMMGRGKALFMGNAMFATAFARILFRRTSSAQIARMQRQGVAGSAIDEAAIDDPETLADIVRASRQSALGMFGFLAEMQAHGAGSRPPSLPCGRQWRILAGARDPLYDFAETAGFWREILPGMSLDLVADGGRWLQLTHVDRVIAALAAIAPVGPAR
jgi:hypothetical protein